MSIRMLALELYSVMKRIKEMEKKLKNLPPAAPERGEMDRELRSARAEETRLKAMLEGAKD